MRNDTMNEYLRSLIAIVAEPTPSDASTVDEWRQTNRPLVERLRDLLKAIPIEVQRDGLHLRDLQPRLAGRTSGKMCDHAELGAALRSLGFRRDRQWGQPDKGFRAVWKLDR
jgi:hypothetical protein